MSGGRDPGPGGHLQTSGVTAGGRAKSQRAAQMDLHSCVWTPGLCSEGYCVVKGESRNLRLALNHKTIGFEDIFSGTNLLALLCICLGSDSSAAAFLCQPCLSVWAETQVCILGSRAKY